MTRRASQSSLHDPRLEGLVLWRRRRLEQAGFDRGLAEQLAGDARFDLHAVLELVDRGCSTELAARILAPLDDGQETPR
jgi:hypothetical protein